MTWQLLSRARCRRYAILAMRASAFGVGAGGTYRLSAAHEREGDRECRQCGFFNLPTLANCDACGAPESKAPGLPAPPKKVAAARKSIKAKLGSG